MACLVVHFMESMRYLVKGLSGVETESEIMNNRFINKGILNTLV